MLPGVKRVKSCWLEIRDNSLPLLKRKKKFNAIIRLPSTQSGPNCKWKVSIRSQERKRGRGGGEVENNFPSLKKLSKPVEMKQKPDCRAPRRGNRRTRRGAACWEARIMAGRIYRNGTFHNYSFHLDGKWKTNFKIFAKWMPWGEGGRRSVGGKKNSRIYNFNQQQ